jgi:quinol monooxygenase YgiN
MAACGTGTGWGSLQSLAFPPTTTAEISMTVVRISRGRFRPEQFETVEEALATGAKTLVPAIRALPGLIHYYAGVDRVTSGVVNVSFWQDLASARQMEGLLAMHEQREVFLGLGVVFDEIANFERVWEIEP